MRVSLVAHVRGSVKAAGSRLPGASTETFAQVSAAHLPEQLAPALAPVLQVIGELTARIHEYDKTIERLCRERYPQTGALTQVPGVGSLTALA